MTGQPTVVVTGANGFVGSAVFAPLIARGIHTRAIVRRSSEKLPCTAEQTVIGDINDHTDWNDALAGARAVVHLAARVHVMHDSARDPLAEFRKTNVAASIRLAECAAASGVRRFVYLSSIKVNGEEGTYTEESSPAPRDPYGVSKSEAEAALREIAVRAGMDVVIIRPPLVYGPGVRGNFRSLIDVVRRGIPLPLGAVQNSRSLVGVDNLADFIATCIDHPAAANQTFLVSDGEDLSTPALIERLARAMGKTPRLLNVPPSMLAAVAALLGRRAAAQRLLGTLRVDISKARRLLDWTPRVGVDDALRRAVVGS